MKLRRILHISLWLLLVLILLLASVILFWLGSTVKLVAEKVGSKALGAPVRIEHLSINPRNGTVNLAGFRIATHEGFSRSNTVALATLHVSADIGSVFTDTLVIHEVRLDSPSFTFEHNAATDDLTEKFKSILAFANINPDEPEKEMPEKKEPGHGKGPKRIIIESLDVNNAQLHVANTDNPDLDVYVAIGELSLSLTNGFVHLGNLRVSSPGALDYPNVFELESINVEIDPATLYAPPLVIQDVRIAKPYAYLERNPNANTVGEFLKEAEALLIHAPVGDTNAATSASSARTAESRPAAPPPELRNLVIDDIRLKLLDTVNTKAPANPATIASIEEISVNLPDGIVHVGAIAIANTAGFTTSNLFELAGIQTRLDPDTLYSRQVVIDEILVVSPSINLERTKTMGNIAEWQQLAESFIPVSAPTPAPPTVAEKPTPTPEPVPLTGQPLILHTLVVTNLSVHMITPPTTNRFVDNPIAVVGKLNPLDKIPLGKLNPLSNSHEGKAPDKSILEGPVTLVAFDQLVVEPLKGFIQLSNLKVGNPRGFANKNLVKLDGFRMAIDPDTLQSDVMLINDVLIHNPTIAYERELTTDNIKAMREFIEGATQPREKEADKAPAEAADTEATGQKVIIAHFLLDSGLIKAKLSALPSAPIPLPKIELNDIGKGKGGTSPMGAVTEIGSTIYDTLIGAVSGATGFAGDMIKGAGALTLGALDAATGGDGSSEEDMKPADEAVGPAAEDAQSTSKKPRRVPGRRPNRIF